MGVTLNTPETIPAYICLHAPVPDGQRVDEIKAFLTLNEGLAGNPGLCSGGILGQVFDSVLAQTSWPNFMNGVFEAMPFMTKSTKIEYIRPVAVPQAVLVISRIVKVEGAVYTLEATVEDERGRVMAKATSIWFLGFVRSMSNL